MRCSVRGVMTVWMVAGVMSAWVAGGVVCAAAAGGATIYVGPGGDDGWGGRIAAANADRTDGPLASLSAAVQAARRLGTETSRRIVVLAGEYFLDAPVVLDGRDNGLVISSAVPGMAVLYGGRVLEGWRQEGDVWVVDVPELRSGDWDFRVLVVDGQLADRARWPETGRLEHLSRFDVPWMSTTGGGWKRKPTAEELTTMRFRAEDLPAGIEAANAEVTVYHMWDESLVGVAAIDRQGGLMRFKSACGHPPGAFGVGEYVVWNVRCGLTRPGQWYLDRAAGRVVYRPRAGQRIETVRVIAPRVEQILRIEGVRDVTVEGLRLSVTTTPLRAGGFGAGSFDGAVEVRNSRGVRLRGLEVFNVAGQGIRASGSEVAIVDCHVHDTGACGIKAPAARIENNHVHDVGRLYPSAIGIFSGGTEAVIVHNEVHDTPYTVINCGGRGHRIEGNRIYRAMQELHDGGAIYVFAGERTVLRGNLAFDIADTGGYGSSAYYLDERSTGCVVEGNVAYGVGRPSHNHMAHGNTIRNNVFIFDGDMRLTFPRCSDFVFEGNVLRASGSITFSGIHAITSMRGNVLDSGAGKIIGRSLDRYSDGGAVDWDPKAANVVGPAGITAYRGGRVVYGPDSAAARRGIGRVDVHTAGVQRSALWDGAPGPGALGGNRYRVIVSTDIGGSDEDDIQSMIHYLLYADVFDTEGLISSPPGGGRKADILKVIDVYARDYPKLVAWSKRYPSPGFLRSISKQGATEPAPEAGFRGPTEGSRWIVACAKKADRRPLYVLVWGAITDVAQALHDEPSIKAKLRVYFIASWNLSQDRQAFAYIEREHPDLWMVVCDTTFRGWYMGGRQDGSWGNRAFVQRYAAECGALGRMFAPLKGGQIKMGDTPSVGFLLRGTPEDPTRPSWGGRFVRRADRPFGWRDDPDPAVAEGGKAGAKTVNRWREAYLGDFRDRLERCR